MSDLRLPSRVFVRSGFLIGTLLVGIQAIGAEEPTPSPGQASTTANLVDKINAFIQAPAYKQAHWGLLVLDLKSGESLYEHDADKLFVPASVTKLYSVAAALDALGADYRFETPVYARGEVDASGRLDGDLILVASGDLSLGGRTDEAGHIAYTNADHIYGGDVELTKGDPLAGLNELARQVAAAGVKTVQGDVLIDDRLFDHAEGTGSGPSYLTPIVVNDNLIDLIITPSTAGQPAALECRPASEATQLDARVQTIAADGRTTIDIEPIGNDRIVVRGEIAAGRKPVVRSVDVADAASFARSLLIEALSRAGVRVRASALQKNPGDRLPPRENYASLRRVGLLTSPPFSESARLVLKVSHNLHASTLPLLVAAEHGQRTLAEGLRRQHDFLARAGVEVETISFGGGAGGHRADYVTPRATVQLLRYMATRGDSACYRDALPVLGVDGTLAKAVGEKSRARGKVQAKTGTLFWHNAMNDGEILTGKSLAGYLTTSAGRELAFAAFVNNVPGKGPADRERVGRALGELCELLCDGP